MTDNQQITPAEYSAHLTTPVQDAKSQAFDLQSYPIISKYLSLEIDRLELARGLFLAAIRCGVVDRIAWPLIVPIKFETQGAN